MISPISLFPKPEPVHFGTGIAEGSVTVRSAAEIEISELFKVSSDDLKLNVNHEMQIKIETYLIGIDENNFFHVQRKQYVQEENFITPNDSLLLGLRR